MRDSHFPVTIKTSAPTLEGTIERGRLIDALARLPSPAKWLQAPSGTGKSTLAAGYARNGTKRLVWYRLDERDNDPAFFYAEFAQAVRAQLRLGKPLPMFAGDDHDRQREFAKRFSAALSEQLSTPALIVLDDMHRVTTDEMQQALASLVPVTESGNEVLFVSQSTAPIAFFDAIATRQLGLLNDADLRFDTDECKAMTAALRIDGKQSESITALTGGHAGALVLACELFRGTDPKSALGVTTAERIHSHLLTKLVERMPHLRRELLLQTAFVPHLSRPIAEALAGIDAARELDALVESGLLRRVGGSGNAEMFEAHGLVRQGMQALARSQFGHAVSKALAELTATVLTEHGQLEEAFALLAENESTPRALRALEQLAQGYAEQGQVDLLLASIGKVPAPEVERNGWLCFWTGQALLRVDEQQARQWLGRSYAAFEAAGESAGMRLAAASVVTAFGLECGDLRELDAWIERHKSAGGETPITEADRFETSLIMGVMCAAFVRAAYPPGIDSEALIARMRSLLDSRSPWLSDDQRVQAARILIEHGLVFSKHELARNVIIATRLLAQDPAGGALHRGRWLIAAAKAHLGSGDIERSVDYLNEARLVAEQSKSSRLSFDLGLAFAAHWMKAQDLQAAAHELQTLENAAANEPPAQRVEYARMMTRLLLLRGQSAEGLRWAEETIRMALPAGFSGANLRTFEMELVYALAANDRFADAIELLRSKDFEPREARLAVEHCLSFLLNGASDPDLLREGLTNARQIGFVNLLDRARAPLERICDAALAQGVETEFVLGLISLKQLTPPPLSGAHWPWSVHVKTLGGFQLQIRGERYRPPHKTQDKPLELLKLLVTCQALGRDSAEKTWIEERLWPDAEAGNARKSLEMTVGRLRRLLGREDTIVSNEGRLQLSPAHVWTDIRPLQHALSKIRALHDDRAAGLRAPSSAAADGIAAVLEHYRGPYLAHEEGPPWLLAGREAMTTAVRNAMLAADSTLDGSSDALLIQALERVFAADPTSEDLARALMRAHLRQGRNAEAVRVYRRLREMLSLLLGFTPSAESDRIRDQAYAAESKKNPPSSVAAAQPLSEALSKERSHGNKQRGTAKAAGGSAESS